MVFEDDNYRRSVPLKKLEQDFFPNFVMSALMGFVLYLCRALSCLIAESTFR